MVIKKVADFNPKSGLFQRIRIPPPNERLVDYCFASSFLSFSSSLFSSSFCLNFCYFLFIYYFSSLFFFFSSFFFLSVFFRYLLFLLILLFFLFLTSTLRGVDAIAMYVITVRKQYITISPTVQLWNDYLPSDSVLTRRNVDFFFFLLLLSCPFIMILMCFSLLIVHYSLSICFMRLLLMLLFMCIQCSVIDIWSAFILCS